MFSTLPLARSSVACVSTEPASRAEESPDEVERLVRERIAPLLERRFGLAALWLFGSQASGRTHSGSDVDLAALFARRPTVEQWLDVQGELAGLGGREIDLVDLDHASPILAMQVLRHGRLLVENDPRRRIAFAAGVPARYEDLKIFRRPIEAALLRRFGGRS
jgi:predicted nucleotidyltransferase